jgi:peptidyl-prolyl cis-trans isomerase SurA
VLAADAKPAKNAVETGPATQPATDPKILAQRIHDGARTLNAFQVYAQKYSAGPTAANGGQLDWLALSALPAPVAAAVRALKPGEMTDPLPVDGGIALYWLRDESEGPGKSLPAMDVDFARLIFPTGAAAAEAAGRALRCGDLYPVARALGQTGMGRTTEAEAALPADLRAALASMDPGEVRLTPVAGGVELLMLCDRTPQSTVPPSRDAVKSQLANRKLMIMAEGWMQQMRSDAIITDY